jgi:multidrug efflux pump subunit AcrB
VVLTAMAAVLAFVPLSFNVFWGPMAIAMIGGLLGATGLTLVFLPALSALVLRAPREAKPEAAKSTLLVRT